ALELHELDLKIAQLLFVIGRTFGHALSRQQTGGEFVPARLKITQASTLNSTPISRQRRAASATDPRDRSADARSFQPSTSATCDGASSSDGTCDPCRLRSAPCGSFRPGRSEASRGPIRRG